MECVFPHIVLPLLKRGFLEPSDMCNLFSAMPSTGTLWKEYQRVKDFDWHPQILIGRSKRQSIPTELTYAWHAFSLRHGPRGRSSSYSKGSEYKPVSSFEYALLNGTNLCTNSRSPIWYASTYLAWSPFFFLVSTGAVQQRKCRSRVLRPKSSDFE